MVGLDENRISRYIESNISKCIDLSIFEKQGLMITSRNLEANTVLAVNSVNVNLKFPLSIIREEQTATIDSFHSSISLLSQTHIPVDSNGLVTRQISISNGESTLVIPEGTRALDANGNPLDSVSMRILGATYPLVGFFKYDFTPNGATFDSPIILTTNYKDSDLPNGFHEQDLEIKYFNDDENKWISLPSNIDVVNNKLITEISHFSEFGPAVSEESINQQNQVFIISDKNWKNIFQLIPLTIWTQSSELHKQPLLIFHEEESSFDGDSIIHFLQQYNTDKVTLVGNTPAEFDNLLVADNGFGVGLSTNQIQRISPKIIIDYWNSYDSIVYVEDDYKPAMLASTYASLINSPLIIQNGILDTPSNFENKNVIRIGNVQCPADATCDEQYTLKELQQKYIELTNTDKVILVNPNDFAFYINEEFTPDLSGNSISQIYGKTSLAAPILAAAKTELILFYDNVDSTIEKNGYCSRTNIEPIIEDIETTLNENVNSLPLNLNYLTIIAAPNAIPDSEYMGGGHCVNEAQHGQRWATDRRLIENTKTGRIYSLTISDVSSYIARSVFYDSLINNIYGEELTGQTITSSIREGHDAFYIRSGGIINYLTKSIGYHTNCILRGLGVSQPQDYVDEELMNCESVSSSELIPIDSLSDRQFIINYGHGNPEGWADYLTAENLPDLSLSYMHAFSCSTAYFWKASTRSGASSQANRFAAQTLRRGAMGYHGLVGPGSDTNECPDCIAHAAYLGLGKLLTEQGVTLGELDKYLIDTMKPNAPNIEFFTLLGDPTLSLKFGEIDDWPSARRSSR